jgi:phosphatidylethanolamine/phosphatidyl-N-methylethanolamine N-methyltransferase
MLGSPRESYTAVVSGLPLINFSMRVRRAVIEDALARVKPGGPFIQVSYRGTPAIPESSDISVRRASFVWRNIPPGYVWVYRRQPIKN